MTLVVSHRLNQTDSIFLNDLRISPKYGNDIRGSRTDDVVKQLHMTDEGNHIGFFATGPRAYWQEAEKEVGDVLADLTPDDVLEEFGMLQRALTDAASDGREWPIDDEGNVHTAHASAFFLDLETEETVVFTANVHLGKGCLPLEEAPIGEPVVLGSGASIEGLEDTISDAADRLTNKRQHFESYFRVNRMNPKDFEDFFSSSYEVANGLRQAILDYIQSKDPALFEGKGISPFLMISILEDGRFRVVGEGSEGFQVKNGVWTQTGYRVDGDLDESVQITFPDGSSQKLTDLRQIDRPGSGRVDPECREPPPLSAENLGDEEHVIQLRQTICHANWIHEESEGEASLSALPPLDGLSGDTKEVSNDDVEALMENLRGSVFAQQGFIIRELVELQINTDLERVERQNTHALESRTFALDDADEELLNADHTLTCVIDDSQALLDKIRNQPSRVFDAEWLSDSFPDYMREEAFARVDSADLE